MKAKPKRKSGWDHRSVINIGETAQLKSRLTNIEDGVHSTNIDLEALTRKVTELEQSVADALKINDRVSAVQSDLYHMRNQLNDHSARITEITEKDKAKAKASTSFIPNAHYWVKRHAVWVIYQATFRGEKLLRLGCAEVLPMDVEDYSVKLILIPEPKE